MKPYYERKEIRVFHGDCREVLPHLADQSVDITMTDPPYTKKLVHLYDDLAREAARVNKPQTFVYAYAGAEVLPNVLAFMGEYLTWFWLYNIKHMRGKPRMWYKRIMVTSKPVVVFTTGKIPQKELKWTGCDFSGETESKEYHKWGQHIGFPLKQIELRTNEGDLVLDPFLGGGTTLAACVATNRRGIGIEIEEKHCETSARRLDKLLDALQEITP